MRFQNSNIIDIDDSNYFFEVFISTQALDLMNIYCFNKSTKQSMCCCTMQYDKKH